MGGLGGLGWGRRGVVRVRRGRGVVGEGALI